MPTADAILAALRLKADPERQKVSAYFAPSTLEILGVTVPDLRAIVKENAALLKRASAAEMLGIAQDLVASGTHEGRQVAYELIEGHKATREALDEDTIEALGRGMDNWASVDVFSVCVTGPAWRNGRLSDDRVRAWAGSPDRWWRRCALVSTVPLNMKSRGGKGDSARTLMICERLATDRDDMVQKALSWALRELLPWDRDAVACFIERPEVPARVRRETRTKMETGRKNG